MLINLKNKSGAKPLLISAITGVLILAINSTYSAEAQETASRITGKIDAVTLYTDRALIRRVHDISREKENGIIRFKELPQSIMTDSVRARGEGVTITSVSLKTASINENLELEEHPVRKKIDELAKERKALNDNISNYNEQLKLLNSYMRLSTGETDKEARSNTIRTENWKDAMEFIETRRSMYQEKIRAADEKLIELQKKINRESKELDRLTRAKIYSNYEVEVSYIISSGSKSKIFLDYMVSNVSWTGYYDLRGSSEASEFKLISQASIHQTTGEEWKDVLITLSSARPSYAVSPSLLKPWRLDAESLNSLGGRDSGKGGNIDDDDDEEDGTEGTGEDGGEDSGDASETATLTIDLPNRETIASDNSEHKVTLNNSELKAVLTHVAIPSVSNFVYLKAKLKNSSGMPILWAKMNIFLDGNFVGTSNLNYRAAAGEDFEVFLGPDQRLQLKRILKKGEVGSSGVFNKTVDITNEWQIEVSNYSRKTRQILVYDQYPIPADPKISTRFLGSSRSDVQKDDNGILVWRLEIKANEITRFDFSYSLSIPTEIWEQYVSLQRDQDSLPENEMNNNMIQQQRPAKQYNLEKMMKK